MNARQIAISYWYMYGRTGVSSKTIAQWLGFGKKMEDRDHPHDPADFNRCLELLHAVPGLREDLPKIAKISKEWGHLVKHWGVVESTFLEEAGRDWSKNNRAQKTYDLMKLVLAGQYVPAVAA